MTKIQILDSQIKDWKIKYQNLSVAKEISEDFLTGQINDLKIENTKKVKQIDLMFESIRKLDEKMDTLTVQVAELTKENSILKETVVSQNGQIEKLKARINKDSNNSSKPSSTDGFKKTIQNNREKSGKNLGGQPGHKGVGLLYFENPTKIIDKKVDTCIRCSGKVLSSEKYKAKQLVDVKFVVSIIEERVFDGVCSICGKIHQAAFSEEFINPVQYGNGLKSLVTLLNSHGFVSINKTTDIINSLTGNLLNISDATVVNVQNSLSAKLENIINDIKNQLIEDDVICADETGFRVNAKTHWIQVFSNKLFTLCGHNEKRGACAIDEMGVLDAFIGILVHDHFSTYYKNTLVTHAECNAHILRYLKSIIETFKHNWAKEMIEFLVATLHTKKESLSMGRSELSSSELEKISNKYDTILEKGQNEYAVSIQGKKNISYSNDEKLLLKRLCEFKDEHLRFITNFNAPFDNNQAERDLRSFKTKTKVSGSFRSNVSANSFARIYSVISTLKKQKRNIFKSIRDVFDGKEIVFT